MIEIEIDGKTLQVEPGKMVIEVADDAGISIPRFCYHKKLSIAANCRMCLVEVEKSPKPLPACATPVTPGMKVLTQSAKAIASQKSVMEFLLINHPLDCPICDQGGECELQDVSMGYGEDVSEYTEGKRSVYDENLGPLIATDMTRCILCTRCVRFGTEIAGLRELGATYRGEDMRIGTFVKHAMQSEVSGNIIDLCPVGALTSKPYRFRARPWELEQVPSIAAHDCIGSNIYVHSRRGTVMRVVPRSQEAVNECWLSDRDRFSYVAVNAPDRLTRPMIKRNDVWEEVDWSAALNFAIEGLRRVYNQNGPEQIGALIAPSATTEECYLLQKIMRGIGSHNIDHRLQQLDTRDQASLPIMPISSIPIAEIENQDLIILIGSNIQHEQPLLSLRIRQATLQDAKVYCINPINYDFNFKTQDNFIVHSNQMVKEVASLLKAVFHVTQQTIPTEFNPFLDSIEIHAHHQRIVQEWQTAQHKLILVGALAQNHPQAAVLRWLANGLAKAMSANSAHLTPGANGAGAWMAGAIPHREAAAVPVKESGLSASQQFENPLQAYLLFNVEPELDCANPAQALHALMQAEWVISCSPFKNEKLLKYADVILPIATFVENEGTYINVEGKWQTFKATTALVGESKPGWKVLRVLGNLLNLSQFEFTTAAEVLAELHGLTDAAASKVITNTFEPPMLTAAPQTLTRIADWPIYRGDNIVRRSLPLQQTVTQLPLAIRVNNTTAQQLGLIADQLLQIKQDEVMVELPWLVDERLPNNTVYLPMGYEQTALLGKGYADVEVRHV